MDKILKNFEEGIKNGREKALANSRLNDGVSNDSLNEDTTNKINCLIGYLQIWLDGGERPYELAGVVLEAEEWVNRNSC